MKITKEQFDAMPSSMQEAFTVVADDANSYTNGEENVDGLKSALAKEKEAKVAAAKERDAFKEGEEKRIAAATKKALDEAKEKGDWKTVEADYKKREAAQAKEIAALKAANEAAATKDTHAKATKEILDMFTAPEAMSAFVDTRVKTVVEDGVAVTRILDKDGNPSATTIEEFKKEILDTESLKGILVASKGNGGGATRPTDGDGVTTGDKAFSATKSEPADMVAKLEAQGITGED